MHMCVFLKCAPRTRHSSGWKPRLGSGCMGQVATPKTKPCPKEVAEAEARAAWARRSLRAAGKRSSVDSDALTRAPAHRSAPPTAGRATRTRLASEPASGSNAASVAWTTASRGAAAQAGAAT